MGVASQCMAGVCQVCVSVLGCVREQICVGGKFHSAGVSDALAGRDPCICVSRSVSVRVCVHALVLSTETVFIGVIAVCQCVHVPLSISYMCECDCWHECGYKSVV